MKRKRRGGPNITEVMLFLKPDLGPLAQTSSLWTVTWQRPWASEMCLVCFLTLHNVPPRPQQSLRRAHLSSHESAPRWLPVGGWGEAGSTALWPPIRSPMWLRCKRLCLGLFQKAASAQGRVCAVEGKGRGGGRRGHATLYWPLVCRDARCQERCWQKAKAERRKAKPR